MTETYVVKGINFHIEKILPTFYLIPSWGLEMDLSQEGPGQNFEYSIFAWHQILKILLFFNFLIRGSPESLSCGTGLP